MVRARRFNNVVFMDPFDKHNGVIQMLRIILFRMKREEIDTI